MWLKEYLREKWFINNQAGLFFAFGRYFKCITLKGDYVEDNIIINEKLPVTNALSTNGMCLRQQDRKAKKKKRRRPGSSRRG